LVLVLVLPLPLPRLVPLMVLLPLPWPLLAGCLTMLASVPLPAAPPTCTAAPMPLAWARSLLLLLLLLLLVAAAAAAALGPVTGVSAAADIPARPGGAGNWNPLPGGDVGTAAGQAPGTLDSCGPPLALAAVLLPAGGCSSSGSREYADNRLEMESVGEGCAGSRGDAAVGCRPLLLLPLPLPPPLALLPLPLV